MFRYFIQLSYKGTNYHGWQVQPNGISVQEVLNRCLSTILRTEIEILGAGRTDTGVHASFYIAHFETDREDLNDDKFVFKLNCFLPKDIAIQKIYRVNDKAHARFDAVSRTYQYHIVREKNPFHQDFAFSYSLPLNVEKMNQAAKILFEYTDFTSFAKLHTDNKTNNCKIFHAQWTQTTDLLTFTIQADRFLRNMVRAIVGTLLEVGKEKLSLEGFRAIIENKSRALAGVSVDAKGLFLTGIEYPESIYIV